MEEDVAKVLEPGAIEAALAAGRALSEGRDEQLRAVGLKLEQARYQAERSFRQYDASDPENRLVTGELERRWNEALARVSALEERLRGVERTPPRGVAAIRASQVLLSRLPGDPSLPLERWPCICHSPYSSQEIPFY
jgi:hypothetical protein